MTKIASESVPGKAAVAEVKSITEKYQAQIKEKEKQLQKQKAAIEAQLPSLTPQQREIKAKEFQKKVGEFQKYVQKADTDVRARQDELLSRLYQSIAAVSSEYGKANGFTAVVMKKEMLYVDAGAEIKDLTEEIIKKVNAMKPEKKTGAKKGRKTPSRK
jgi:outer membrane protein